MHLDGIKNTKSGHNATATIWEDLSGNNNDFSLGNFNNTDSSGWKDESLIFDGENDFLSSIENFNFNNANKLTIQFVDLNGTLYKNHENLGVLFETSTNFNNNKKSFLVNINELGSQITAIAFRHNSYWNVQYDSEPLIENESSSYTLTFNAENEYNNYVKMYKNNNIKEINRSSQFRQNLSDFTFNNYPMYIGSRAGSSNFTKIRLASVRIYNRVLTEEEIKNNYEVDKVRFNMN